MFFQTAVAKRNVSPIITHAAGVVSKQIVAYEFRDAYATGTDKIEFMAIPSNSQLIGVRGFTSGLGAATVNMGLMTGEFGLVDDARVVGTEIMAGLAQNALVATLENCLAIEPQVDHFPRAIGITLSANVAGGVSEKITFEFEFIQAP